MNNKKVIKIVCPVIKSFKEGLSNNNKQKKINFKIKKTPRIFKDKNGKLLKSVKKIESFGKFYIVFKYLEASQFLVIRKDLIMSRLSVVSN